LRAKHEYRCKKHHANPTPRTFTAVIAAYKRG
jgi:hypothetical protein